MDNSGLRIGLIGLAVIATVAIGMWVLSPTEVVVTGIGNVSVPATTATFNVTISASGDKPSDAILSLRTKIDNLKSQLGIVNIGSDSITETQITLTPSAAIVANAKGFQALTTLTIKTNNVRLVSDMMVTMYESGATVVSQPVVSVEDEDTLEKEALKEAMTQAKQNLNETVGFRPIKKVIGIQQASSGNTATTTKATADNAGEFEVTKAVSVTYRVW